MRKIVLICIVVFTVQICHGQPEKIFNIKDTVINNIFGRKHKSSFINRNTYFFEDENYLCTKLCNGEFGGKIIFKSKKTGKEKLFDATCPVAVNKLNAKYYITSSIDHMIGFTNVIEIDTNLIEKKLVDTIGILALTSFTYKEQLFHIITNQKKTYLAKIDGNKFINIDLISDKVIWTNDPEILYTNENHLIIFFKNYKTEGYIDIFEKNINVIRYK